MLNDSSPHHEIHTDDEKNSMSINNSSPSLLDLPTELILHIIRMLPQSPYHKCLSVCKRLYEIENRYVAECSAMCICRLHNHSPNLPSHVLKLRICMHAGQCQLDALVKIIKRQSPTCQTKITGEKSNVERFKDYLEKHDDHPNIKVFLGNCESKIVYLSRHDLFNKSIDLHKEGKNHFDTEFTTFYLSMSLGEDRDLNKRFCNILPGSCFSNVRIDCNSVSFHFFDDCLKNNCHIFDVLNFQKKVNALSIDHVTFTPIHANLLNGLHNLGELTLKINEVDLENVKNRILELIHLFKQANLRQLYTFRLFENSSFGYSRDLIPAWADLLVIVPSKNLQRLEIINKTSQYQSQLTTQSELSDSLSLLHNALRFARLQFLTINHVGFDSTLIKILLPLRRLIDLDISISMNMSNKNEIDELCHNLENCKSLEHLKMYVPAEATPVFGNIFVSLTKLQRLSTIHLNFDSPKRIPPDECFEELGLLKNLKYVNLHMKTREFNTTKISYETLEELKRKFVNFVPKQCTVSID